LFLHLPRFKSLCWGSQHHFLDRRSGFAVEDEGICGPRSFNRRWPHPPVRRSHLNPFVGFGRDPSTDDSTARKRNTARTIFCNDGQLKITGVRRGSYWLPIRTKKCRPLADPRYRPSHRTKGAPDGENFCRLTRVCQLAAIFELIDNVIGQCKALALSQSLLEATHNLAGLIGPTIHEALDYKAAALVGTPDRGIRHSVFEKVGVNEPRNLAPTLARQTEMTRLARCDRYCSASECRLSGELRRSPACTRPVAFDPFETSEVLERRRRAERRQTRLRSPTACYWRQVLVGTGIVMGSQSAWRKTSGP